MGLMPSDGDSAQDAVCLAVCLGWRMAELYDSKKLPGPPQHGGNGKLPEHLPGLGEMTDHEKACALVAHMSADLATLATALGLPEVPDLGKVRDKLQLPGLTRDEVRKVILDVYKEIRNLIAGSNALVAIGFGLGRMLADTTLLPTADDPQKLADEFEEHRLANAFGWLEDLDTSLPSHAAAAVRATLAQWAQWVDGLPRAGDGTIDPVAVDGTVIRALRQQGEVWRHLLTGEQRPDQLLDQQAYIAAAVRLLAAAWHVARRHLLKWSWLIVLVAGAAGIALWAALNYAPGGTSRVAAVAVSSAGFLGISWLGVRATLGRALRQAESALWETEVATAIAQAAARLPKNQRHRRARELSDPALR